MQVWYHLWSNHWEQFGLHYIILSHDTFTCRLKKQGNEPPTFWYFNNLLYPGTQSPSDKTENNSICNHREILINIIHIQMIYSSPSSRQTLQKKLKKRVTEDDSGSSFYKVVHQMMVQNIHQHSQDSKNRFFEKLHYIWVGKLLDDDCLKLSVGEKCLHISFQSLPVCFCPCTEVRWLFLR